MEGLVFARVVFNTKMIEIMSLLKLCIIVCKNLEFDKIWCDEVISSHMSDIVSSMEDVCSWILTILGVTKIVSFYAKENHDVNVSTAITQLK